MSKACQFLMVDAGACPLSSAQPGTSICALPTLAHLHRSGYKSALPCCDRTLEKGRLGEDRCVLFRLSVSEAHGLSSIAFGPGVRLHTLTEACGSQETKEGGLDSTASFRGCIWWKSTFFNYAHRQTYKYNKYISTSLFVLLLCI